MSDRIFEEKADDFDFAATAEYEVVKTQEQLENAARYLARSTLLAVDTENAGIDPHEWWPLLLQISDATKCYIFEAYNDTLDYTPIKSLLEDPAITKVFFQAKYDWKWLAVHWGIEVQNLFCCQVAERLLTVGLPNARRRPSLADVVLKYLGIKLRKEARNAFIGRYPDIEPITEAEFRYAAADVLLLIEVFFQQVEGLKALELSTVSALEMEVLPILADSEITGVKLDKEKWYLLLAEAEARLRRYASKVFEYFEPVIAQKTIFGVPTFNLGSQPQLLNYLNKLGFELPSTGEEELKKYRDQHPVFAALLEWRGYNKIATSYGSKFLDNICAKTGRLHCQFNQVEADTGRSSSSGPNLQQVLGFDPDNPESLNFRSCFVSKLGYDLITADYSQQELRILADMSGDETFCKAYTTLTKDGEELDVHRYTASVIFDTPYDDVTKTQRTRAKTLNFFLVYGGGSYALAATLGISPEEAQEIIDAYFTRYSGIRQFLNTKAAEALHNGYSETVSGRKRFLTLPSPDDPIYEKAKAGIKRKGKNSPIQGSGADVTKQGMVFVARALRKAGLDAKILMVVHDELVIEVRKDQAEQAARIVEEEMVRGFTHFFKNIPMRVDAHISDAWEK